MQACFLYTAHARRDVTSEHCLMSLHSGAAPACLCSCLSFHILQTPLHSLRDPLRLGLCVTWESTSVAGRPGVLGRLLAHAPDILQSRLPAGCSPTPTLLMPCPSCRVTLGCALNPQPCRWLQAYLAGLTFALAASPCSTPVLATLLAFVASTGDTVKGGSLLLAYTSG